MKTIPKTGTFTATLTAPSSKSYTNRALLLAMMTEGATVIENPLDSDDSRFMLEAIRKLGFAVEGSLRDHVTVGPRYTMYADQLELFVGNAGTAMRFLTGVLPFTPGRYLLCGESRMHQRPIGHLVDCLIDQLGAEIEYAGSEGFPPISIRGRRMRGGMTVRLDASVSSQFASALMMGGATLPSGLVLEITSAASRPYIEMTASILRRFGASVEVEGLNGGLRVRIEGGNLALERYRVEGDWSSASYWLAAAAATGGEVRLDGLERKSVQGDRRIVEILERMGATTRWEGESLVLTGSGELRGGQFDMNDVPDLVPTIAAISPLASSPVEILNVANLRVKESDRIAAVTEELRRLGATVDERSDGLRIEPGWNDEPATIDPHDDHRLAMAFAVAGLARGNVSIDQERVVSKSYPRFWRDLDSVTSRT